MLPVLMTYIYKIKFNYLLNHMNKVICITLSNYHFDFIVNFIATLINLPNNRYIKY